MNMLNNLIIEGQVSKEVEFSYTEKGNAIAKSAVASSRYIMTEEGERKEEITTVEFVCFGKMAEDFERISKAKKNIRIVGRLKSEGEKVFIICEHIEYKAR